MPNALGIAGALIPATGTVGGPGLFTTIVTDDAELATALTTDGGDTFITAGAYTIDTDAVGAMNTTPRRIVGAGRQAQGTGPFAGPGVIIEFIGAGGSITALDFSAGLTESEGVELENVSLFSSTAALTSFLVGLYSAKNINMNGGSVVAVGMSDSLNVVNCSFVNGSAGSIGFFGCTGLANCSVGSLTATEGAETGFFICEDLVNCHVYYEAGAVSSFVAAFQFCLRMSNCEADLEAATSVGGFGAIIFNGCTDLTNCIAKGPTIGAIATLDAFESCERLTDCDALRFAQNFESCTQLANCTSTQGVGGGTDGTHFTNCGRLTGCVVDGTGDDAGIDAFDTCEDMAACRATSATGIGFFECNQVSASVAETCTGNGFQTCLQVSACFSNLNGGIGFFDCGMVSSCDATSNTGDGFNACAGITACNAVANAFGYASNVLCGVCTGVANLTALTDGANVIFDPVTCPGFP